MKIYKKILYPVSLIIVCSVLLTGFLTIKLIYSSFHDEFEKKNISLSRHLADNISKDLENYGRIVQLLSESIVTAINIEDALITMHRHYPELVQIYYCSLDGKIIESYPGQSNPAVFDFAGKGYWQEVVIKWNQIIKKYGKKPNADLKSASGYDYSNAVCISDVNSDFGLAGVVVSVPVILFSGTDAMPYIQGVVSAVIPLKIIFRQIKKMVIGKTGFVFVLDNRGRILCHKKQDNVFTEFKILANGNKTMDKIEKAMISMSDGIGYYKQNNKKSFIAFAPVKPVEWSLAVKGDINEFSGNIRKFAAIILIVISLELLVAAILINYFIRKFIIYPVESLITSVNRMKQGNLDENAPVNSKDEIGQLAMAFNDMSRQLRKNFEQLEKQNLLISESKQKFQAIFDGAFQFIGFLSPDGTILKINKTALDKFSVDETIFGKPFWEGPWWSHSKKEREKLKDAIAKAANGQFIRFETTHVLPDSGRKIYIDFSLTPITNDNNEVLFLIPEGRDITEKKITEEKLKRYRNQLENLVEERTAELEMANAKLIKALNEVKKLTGLLPICASCKKIRDDTGYWNQIESYISKHSEATFSHSICPDCAKKLYPEIFKKLKDSGDWNI